MELYISMLNEKSECYIGFSNPDFYFLFCFKKFVRPASLMYIKQLFEMQK